MLTATITPMAKAHTQRADPEQRLRDYEDALRFYLKLSGGEIDGILFLENSGSDLSTLKKIAHEENANEIPVKFFSALADCNPGFGKGHAELQLMDRAFERELARRPDTFRVWKITGRLKILNIEKMISKAPKEFSVYIDLRRLPSWLRRYHIHNEWADTRIVGFTPNGYRDHFYGKRAVVGTRGRPSHVIELALIPSLYSAWESGANIVPRFNVQPVMVGIGAETLKDYSDFPSRVKNVIRGAARLLAPRIWL